MKRPVRAAPILALLILVLVAAGCAPAAAPPAPATSAPAPPAAVPAAQPTATQPAAAAAAPAAGGAAAELTFACWSGPQEQIYKADLPTFEKANNVKINYLIGSTGDRVTKLYAEKGKPTIDVALIPIDELPGLVKNGIVMPTNEKIPNYDKLVPAARVKGGYGTSLLMLVIGYNTNTIKMPPTSVEDFGQAEYKGHVAIGVPLGVQADGLLTLLAKNGGGSETNLAPGFEKLKAWKPYKSLVTSFNAIQPLFTAGDVWLYYTNSGLILGFKKQGGPIEVAVPKEGGVLTMNVAVIPQGVKNAALAEKLVGELIGVNLQRIHAEQLFYGPVNSDVKLAPELVPLIHPTATDKTVTLDWEALSNQKEAITEQFNKDVVGR